MYTSGTLSVPVASLDGPCSPADTPCPAVLSSCQSEAVCDVCFPATCTTKVDTEGTRSKAVSLEIRNIG